jgi:hypothetical protein
VAAIVMVLWRGIVAPQSRTPKLESTEQADRRSIHFHLSRRAPPTSYGCFRRCAIAVLDKQFPVQRAELPLQYTKVSQTNLLVGHKLMSRSVATFIVVVAAVLSLGAKFGDQPPPPEVDTLLVGGQVTVSNVKGQVFRVVLEPIRSGEALGPGELMLVRKNASFAIGDTTIAPESHRDRFVRVE